MQVATLSASLCFIGLSASFTSSSSFSTPRKARSQSQALPCLRNTQHHPGLLLTLWVFNAMDITMTRFFFVFFLHCDLNQLSADSNSMYTDDINTWIPKEHFPCHTFKSKLLMPIGSHCTPSPRFLHSFPFSPNGVMLPSVQAWKCRRHSWFLSFSNHLCPIQPMP